MDNVKGILILSVIVLFGATFFLFIKSNSQERDLEGATLLSQRTLELLRMQKVRCDAPVTEPGQIAEECLSTLLQAKDFKEDAFRQPTQKGDPGYLVIRNANRRAYEAERFTFSFNRELAQTGCTIKGEIGYDVTCRFEFANECQEGDVLEVFYPKNSTGEPVRVFLKTC